MSKKIQISIPTPCHENWENMTPTEKGKFCSSCQKQVIDFSLMSDREIATFFKKPSTGSTCGRFTNDQLNRNIEIPKKRIPWVKYFFQFTLPAFLISMKVSAQNRSPKNDVVFVDEKKQNANDTIVLPEVITVGYRSMGKVSPQLSVKEIKKDSSFNSEYNTSYSLGGIAGGIMVCRKNITIIDSLVEKIFNKTNDSIKIFPNPINKGSNFQIQFNLKNTGEYMMNVFDLNGREISSKQINISFKNQVENFVTDNRFSGGTYIVRFTSKQTGKSFSQKIIIQ